MSKPVWTIAAAVTAALVAHPGPAAAAAADPGRSTLTIQVPALAPGAVGTAPLYGELRANGGFLLHASPSQAHTGSAMRDALIRQFVPGTVSLAAEAPVKVRNLPNGHTMRASGVVYVAGTAMRVPLFIRVTRLAGGTSLRTYFRVPLAAYGVVNPAGGSPGDVRVAINAIFPR